MADVFSKQKRSEVMSGIRGKDTKPELLVRKRLHSKGFRYRLHNRNLPGRPDLAFPRYHAVILINGCFWHKHDCHLFKWPSTREEFWKIKLTGNEERDRNNILKLHSAGWRVLVIWECSLKGKTRLAPETVVEKAADFLRSGTQFMEITGEMKNG